MNSLVIATCSPPQKHVFKEIKQNKEEEEVISEQQVSAAFKQITGSLSQAFERSGW